MCKEPASAADVRAAMPHPVAGSAADPIALEPVDDVNTPPMVPLNLNWSLAFRRDLG